MFYVFNAHNYITINARNTIIVPRDAKLSFKHILFNAFFL